MVFDCAAKFDGVALNDAVLQGPDLTNGLLGILLRFRQFPVAVSADVEAMFHQVRVPEEDRDVLRFLWWPDGNREMKAETYRMAVHLFGGTWSPSVCSYALQQTAKDSVQIFKPEIVKTVLKDFYVDDCLTSFPREESAIQMVTDLPKLLATGGFRLCKWVSNRKEVLRAVPESERAPGLQNLNLQALPTERTLGFLWNVNTDMFTYSTMSTRHPLTRRGMLGAVCAVYDPMGLITPFTIRGKALIQELTRERVNWDEPLSEEHLARWKEWLEELDGCPGLQIERCLQPVESINRTELQHFSDASMTAYGSASYIRVVSPTGDVRCSLLFSRSQVAPLKQITIPRLELAAAALSVQQDQMMRKELTLHIDASFFWTDSTIVLAYIRNEKKRFQTYVANRLAVIHGGSAAGQWKHVTSESNPADDITRGLAMQDLIHSQRWFRGPEFLSKQGITEEAEPPNVSLEDDPEVKHTATAVTVKAERDVIHDLFERYSSWTQLKRAMVWIMRYRAYLLAKTGKEKPSQAKKRLDVSELAEAERAIISYVQRQEYPEEIQSLQGRVGIKKSSKLYPLDPELTAEGILVCNTRSQRVMPRESVPRPAILPKDHQVSTLLVRHYHELAGHGGREYTMAEVRRRYWIPGVRTAIRRILCQCPRCRLLFSSPGVQRMADLPAERLATDDPPFTNVGVDCFGPFITRSGRRQVKRYGCIFTCLTSRAIHIEVLDSMDTSSFVNALQRFISRRGFPKLIWSDNGSNFVGAERELRESLQEWNQQTIDGFLSQRGVQWRFNPPRGFPHGWGLGEDDSEHATSPKHGDEGAVTE